MRRLNRELIIAVNLAHRIARGGCVPSVFVSRNTSGRVQHRDYTGISRKRKLYGNCFDVNY